MLQKLAIKQYLKKPWCFSHWSYQCAQIL